MFSGSACGTSQCASIDNLHPTSTGTAFHEAKSQKASKDLKPHGLSKKPILAVLLGLEDMRHLPPPPHL